MTQLERLALVFGAYVKATGLSQQTVSRQFFGAGARWQKVLDGGDMGSRLIDKALADFRARWPDGHPFPLDMADSCGVPGLPAPSSSEVAA